MKKSSVQLVTFLMIMVFSNNVFSEDDRPNWDPKLLVGQKLCKICHSKDKIGNQYSVWKDSVHANAFEALASAEAMEVAKKAGITDPQSSGKCLKCHATAYGFTENKITEKVTIEQGVSCQTCHGPGKKYKAKTKHGSKFRDLAKKNGMIFPTAENTCLRCHNQENPTYNPERYTTKDGKKVDFDYDQAFEKIKHAIKR